MTRPTLPLPCDRCGVVAPLTWDGRELLCPQCLAGLEAADTPGTPGTPGDAEDGEEQ